MSEATMEGRRRRDSDRGCGSKEEVCIKRAIAITLDLLVEADVEDIEVRDLGPLGDFDDHDRGIF